MRPMTWRAGKKLEFDSWKVLRQAEPAVKHCVALGGA